MPVNFVQIDEDGLVIGGALVSDEDAADGKGVDFCKGLHGGTWLEAGSVEAPRAGMGWVYLADIDEFLNPKPYSSWTLDRENHTWKPPTARPEDGEYVWNEGEEEWVADSGSSIVYPDQL